MPADQVQADGSDDSGEVHQRKKPQEEGYVEYNTPAPQKASVQKLVRLKKDGRSAGLSGGGANGQVRVSAGILADWSGQA